MKAALVGHGPSLLKSPLGAEIDGHDAVIRIKRCWPLIDGYPQFYGTKTDHVVGSLKIAHDLVTRWRERGVDSFWVFDDSRTYGKDYPVPEGARCDPLLCKRWRDEYLELRHTQKLAECQRPSEHISDEKGHRHQSAGSHAIMYALEWLRPECLSLYGFDSLIGGRFIYSVTRGTDWMQYPDHNWSAEAKLLREMAGYYGYSIVHTDGGVERTQLWRNDAA